MNFLSGYRLGVSLWNFDYQEKHPMLVKYQKIQKIKSKKKRKKLYQNANKENQCKHYRTRHQ
jgi:hypothetical protein